MKLYMKERIVSLTDNFDIKDGRNKPVYRVKGKMFSIGRKFKIYDAQSNEELAQVSEKIVSLLPQMTVKVHGKTVTKIKKKLTLFKDRYKLTDIGWYIEGDIMDYRYSIYNEDKQRVAKIRKKLVSLSDSFVIDIEDKSIDPIYVVAVVLAIDMVRDKEREEIQEANS
ncbi:LURP-one-related/scramblase family protein [Suicoccus acidiformans]|nr:LURP-one-related family protein [Suicoccus acidiformans]